METIEEIIAATVFHGPIETARQLNPKPPISIIPKNIEWELWLLAVAAGGVIIWAVYEYNKYDNLKDSLKEDKQDKVVYSNSSGITSPPISNSPYSGYIRPYQSAWLRAQTNSTDL